MIAQQTEKLPLVDQAEKLRLLARSASPKASVLTITSGKGGVGKTNVAANLAICLAVAGKKVLLLDADLGLANLDVLLPVAPGANLAQVISGKRRLEEIIQTGPAGLRLICGASGITQIADLNEFQRQRLLHDMSALENQADLIIIDTSAGISRNVMTFCQAADHTLVVTTPEPTSITDAYAMIKSITKTGSQAKISLLVNMVDNRPQAKNVFQRVNQVTHKFLGTTLYDAGYILRDPHLAQAVCRRQPVVLAFPRSQAAYCFVALAQKLARARIENPVQPGFFRKVANWFC
jgi:flagellar biosynthesis protein FlhG